MNMLHGNDEDPPGSDTNIQALTTIPDQADTHAQMAVTDVNGHGSVSHKHANGHKGPIQWFRGLLQNKSLQDTTLREALEEVIEGFEEGSEPFAFHERALISNILSMRDKTIVDVMVPRADITAIDINIPKEDLFALLAEKQFSRLPVYRETLDDVVGTIHIKDILHALTSGSDIDIKDLVRGVPIVSPAMPVLDLLLQMQQSTKHMAMVVDEYGGIDGLVTIGDIVESVVGEFEDEFQNEIQPELIRNHDGTLIVDARYDLEEFEKETGQTFLEDDSEDIDTLGGLVFSIAGRIPARGEVLTHANTGIKFEVLDADPRRVSRLRVRNIPLKALSYTESS